MYVCMYVCLLWVYDWNIRVYAQFTNFFGTHAAHDAIECDGTEVEDSEDSSRRPNESRDMEDG